MRITNQKSGRPLATQVAKADRFFPRLRGLMFRNHLPEGGGLYIKPCQAVHTHFMRFPIDVLFLDGDHRVVAVIPAMRPWRFSPVVKSAVAVLELASGAAGETAVGDQLILEP